MLMFLHKEKAETGRNRKEIQKREKKTTTAKKKIAPNSK